MKTISENMFLSASFFQLPEITNISPKEGENPGVHLLLQSAGIITGAAIMLLIAIYEDRIQVPHWEP